MEVCVPSYFKVGKGLKSLKTQWFPGIFFLVIKVWSLLTLFTVAACLYGLQALCLLLKVVFPEDDHPHHPQHGCWIQGEFVFGKIEFAGKGGWAVGYDAMLWLEGLVFWWPQGESNLPRKPPQRASAGEAASEPLCTLQYLGAGPGFWVCGRAHLANRDLGGPVHSRAVGQ